MPNLIQALYNVLQPLLFKMDAETAHNMAIGGLKKIEHAHLLREILGFSLKVEDPRLAVSIRSLNCPNPVGLAAGFDKGAELLPVLPDLGFGFVELGTFTPLPQEGQTKPRLFRYPSERALINRMGFNNPGVKVAVERVRACRGRVSVPLGMNIGKGRDTQLDEAADDYLVMFEHVYPVCDYVVLNVSSPNTPNLRDLQQVSPLRSLLTKINERNRQLSEKSGHPPKLVFTKVSPDLSVEALEEVARLSVENRMGIIATNTTTDRSALKHPVKVEGGLSGAPLRAKANAVLKRLYQITKGVVPLIGVGGVFSAEDAYEKIRLGASLVQVYTGWIYEGPGLLPKINNGLLDLMERDGFKKIQDAVGTL